MTAYAAARICFALVGHVFTNSRGSYDAVIFDRDAIRFVRLWTRFVLVGAIWSMLSLLGGKRLKRKIVD